MDGDELAAINSTGINNDNMVVNKLILKMEFINFYYQFIIRVALLFDFLIEFFNYLLNVIIDLVSCKWGVVWVLTHALAHYSSGVGVRQGGVAVKGSLYKKQFRCC